MSVLLEIENLVVRYGKALALDRLSLRVERHELVAVLGPNGAGKTTLLKAIARTVPASSGNVRFNGTPFARMALRAILRKSTRCFRFSRIAAVSRQILCREGNSRCWPWGAR